MKEYKYYPPYVFNINENITRENMRLYDIRQEKIYNHIKKEYPDYNKLSCIEQYKIYSKAVNDYEKGFF